jgi:hypothetical protein
MGFGRKHLDQGSKIPVFVLMEGQDLHSMGMALMYRFPTPTPSLKRCPYLKRSPGRHQPDFGETLFGRVEESDALREG